MGHLGDLRCLHGKRTVAILVSALAICGFLGAIRLMSSDHKPQAWYPHTVMTTPADDDYGGRRGGARQCGRVRVLVVGLTFAAIDCSLLSVYVASASTHVDEDDQCSPSCARRKLLRSIHAHVHCHQVRRFCPDTLSGVSAPFLIGCDFRQLSDLLRRENFLTTSVDSWVGVSLSTLPGSGYRVNSPGAAFGARNTDSRHQAFFVERKTKEFWFLHIY